MSAPDLSTIKSRMLTDVNHYIPGAELRPRFSVLGVLVSVYAAAVHALYQFAQNLTANILPSTCHDDWLPAWAYVLKKPRKVATYAVGTAVLSGAGVIPIGTLLQSKTGLRYTVTAAVTIVGSGIINLTAAESGYASNTAGDLALLTPIAGIASNATGTLLSGGANQETLMDWRSRLVDAFATRAKIGDADDYAGWAIDSHPAIKYAWVFGNTPSLGDISVMVATDNPDPVPDAATLAVVQANFDRLRNVGCHVLLLPPDTLPVAVVIANVAEASRAAIESAIALHINSLRDPAQTLYVADLHAAIRTVYAGVYTLRSPSQDIAAGASQLIVLQGVSWP